MDHGHGHAPSEDKARDPVCGMSVTIAGAKHVHEHEGSAYYFCCAGLQDQVCR